MMKTKYILPVFAMVLVLGLSNAAFAQLSCNVASTPVSRDTDTGLTEPAGDIIFNCTAGVTATTGATMTVDYTLPITNSTTWPVVGGAVTASKPISIVNVTGFPGGAPTIATVNNAIGTVVITVPAQPVPANSSFTLTGVLLAIAGSGRTSDVANLSVSPGNNVLITAGQNATTVITSILPGIKAPVLGTNPNTATTTTGTILASNVPVLAGGGFQINTTENYIDMYRSKAQFDTVAAGTSGATNGVQLLYTFSGIPTGVTLSGCTAAMTQPAGSVGAVGTVTPTFSATTAGTITAAANTVTVEVTGDANPTSVETITLSCTTFTAGSTATIPFAPGSISATVTLAPVGTAFSATGTVLNGGTTPVGFIPRYIANTLGPVTLINIISATTHMIVPFVSIGNGFDTGFVFANTTADPYGPTTAAGGAKPQSGTVTVYFFPTTGTPFCITSGGAATLPVAGGTGSTACTALTSTTVGLGLSSGGAVAAGASWVVLGSELFKNISGAPAVFNGYAFAIANFTNGHATAFVADATFSGKFASGGPALVLTNPAIAARTAGAAAESIGH